MLCFEWIFYSFMCLHHGLVTGKVLVQLSFADLPILTHLLTQYHQITFFNITTNHIRSLETLGANKFTVENMTFQNSNFCFKIQIIINNKTIICFPWNGKLTPFIFMEMFAKYQVWITVVCQSFFSGKMEIHEKRSWLSSWLKQSHEYFSWDNHGILLHSWKYFTYNRSVSRTFQKQISRPDEMCIAKENTCEGKWGGSWRSKEILWPRC